MVKNLTLFTFSFMIVASLLLGSFAMAQPADSDKDTVLDGLNTTANKANVSKIGESSDATAGLTNFFGIVINSLFGIVAVIFLTVTMIGGFMWMTAQGSEEQISKAKKFITNGLLGLVAIFLSYGLVYLILFTLDATTATPN